jgi:hypothetical protein
MTHHPLANVSVPVERPLTRSSLAQDRSSGSDRDREISSPTDYDALFDRHLREQGRDFRQDEAEHLLQRKIRDGEGACRMSATLASSHRSSGRNSTPRRTLDTGKNVAPRRLSKKGVIIASRMNDMDKENVDDHQEQCR